MQAIVLITLVYVFFVCLFVCLFVDLFNTVFHNTIYFYSQSINAKPFEVSFQRRGCLDHWNAKTQMLACRKQLDINGRPVWDSQVCIGSFTHGGI